MAPNSLTSQAIADNSRGIHPRTESFTSTLERGASPFSKIFSKKSSKQFISNKAEKMYDTRAFQGTAEEEMLTLVFEFVEWVHRSAIVMRTSDLADDRAELLPHFGKKLHGYVTQIVDESKKFAIQCAKTAFPGTSASELETLIYAGVPADLAISSPRAGRYDGPSEWNYAQPPQRGLESGDRPRRAGPATVSTASAAGDSVPGRATSIASYDVEREEDEEDGYREIDRLTESALPVEDTTEADQENRNDSNAIDTADAFAAFTEPTKQ
ncbi:hypothetical protein CDCA_CDCA09G2750 [Cyanidium caldarium]|uniref:Uncharacterized protein n=1 Tax=Cyanidium caldarium TaxID=2771 RepID=A0AAV9IX90_CYACA|nr:hypothetical protein CDCA_CDCA09G2750 [Cyanidium caldarium]